MKPAKLQPALFGGLFIGIVSAIPVIALANCCALWSVVGGAIAARAMQRRHSWPVTLGDGAKVGALSAAIGVPIHIVLSTLERTLFRLGSGSFSDALLLRTDEIPPQFREIVSRPGVVVATMAVLFAAYLLFQVAGATIGGLMGALFFKKAGPPAPPPGTPVAPASPFDASGAPWPPRETWPPRPPDSSSTI